MPTAREKILNRIQKALSNGVQSSNKPDEERSSFFITDGLDLRSKFIDSYARLEGSVFICKNSADLRDQLEELVANKNWNRLHCKRPELLFNEDLDALSFISSIANGDYDAGITNCECLVARTGTVVLSSKQASGRLLPVFTPVHIVIASYRDIVYDIGDAMDLLKKKYGNQLPSGIFFASGPSRTADIEKTLVLGVHGPREVYLFLIDNKI